MKTKIILTFLILLTFTINVFAEETDSENVEGAFSTIGVGARPLGMGGAFTVLADDASATYWNPAGLGFMMEKHLTSMYADLYGLGLITNGYIAYGSPDAGNGAAGFSWIITRVEGLEKVEGVENLETSEKTYTENAFIGTYARRVTDYISVGINGKVYLVSSDLPVDGKDFGANGYGLDFGVTAWPDKRLGLAFVVRDLFTQINWNTETDERIPIKGTFGLAFNPLNILKLEADISGSEEAILKKAAGGAEIHLPIPGLEESLAFRGGVIRTMDVKERFIYTAGIGVGFGMGSIDYAVMLDSEENLGNTHRISANIFWK